MYRIKAGTLVHILREPERKFPRRVLELKADFCFEKEAVAVDPVGTLGECNRASLKRDSDASLWEYKQRGWLGFYHHYRRPDGSQGERIVLVPADRAEYLD